MKFAIGIAALSLIVSGWASLPAHADDTGVGVGVGVGPGGVNVGAGAGVNGTGASTGAYVGPGGVGVGANVGNGAYSSPGYYLDGKYYPGPYTGTATTAVPSNGYYTTPATSTSYVTPAYGTTYGNGYGTTYSSTYGGSYGTPYQNTYYSSAYTNGYSSGYGYASGYGRSGGWRATNSGYTGSVSTYNDGCCSTPTYATTSCGCYEAPRTNCCDPCGRRGLFGNGGFLGTGIGNGY